MTLWRRRKISREPEPSSLSPIWVSTQLLDRTASVLSASGDGREAHEGVAYWAGRRAGGECFVTTCIAPAATTTYGSFDTSAHANANVVMYLASVGLELIGQVHSHPGRFVDHSDGDDDQVTGLIVGAEPVEDGGAACGAPVHDRLDQLDQRSLGARGPRGQGDRQTARGKK